jgi:hypothetical protein
MNNIKHESKLYRFFFLSVAYRYINGWCIAIESILFCIIYTHRHSVISIFNFDLLFRFSIHLTNINRINYRQRIILEKFIKNE